MPGRRFGLVVIDSPQGAHKDFSGAVRFEHFHALKHLGTLLEGARRRRPLRQQAALRPPRARRPRLRPIRRIRFRRMDGARRRFYHANPLNLREYEALAAYEDCAALQGFQLCTLCRCPATAMWRARTPTPIGSRWSCAANENPDRPVYTGRASTCSTSYLAWKIIERLIGWRDDVFFYLMMPPQALAHEQDSDFVHRHADRVMLRRRIPIPPVRSGRGAVQAQRPVDPAAVARRHADLGL